MASPIKKKVEFDAPETRPRSQSFDGSDLKKLHLAIGDQDLKSFGLPSNAITSLETTQGEAKKKAQQIDALDKPPLHRKRSLSSFGDKSKHVDSSNSHGRSNSGEKKDERSKRLESPRAKPNSKEKQDLEKGSSSAASPKKALSILRKHSKSHLTTESKIDSKQLTNPNEMRQSIQKAQEKCLQLPCGIFKLENHFDQIKSTFRAFIAPDFKSGNCITIDSKIIEIAKLTATNDQARYIEFLTHLIQHIDTENVSASSQATLLMTESNLSQFPCIYEEIPSVHVLRSMTPGAFAECFKSLKKIFPSLFQDAVQTRAQPILYYGVQLNLATDSTWTTRFNIDINKKTGTFTTTQLKRLKLQIISPDIAIPTDVGTCHIHWKIDGKLNGTGLLTGSLILDSLIFEKGSDLNLQYLFAKALKLLDEK